MNPPITYFECCQRWPYVDPAREAAWRAKWQDHPNFKAVFG